MKQILFQIDKENDKDRKGRRFREIIDQINLTLEDIPEGLYEVVIRKPSRTSKQNRAMYLFFEFIADELNDKGMYFSRDFFKAEFESEWNGDMVKELIWKPVQKILFNKDKTSELKTDEFSKIVEMLQANFAKKGVNLNFPSIDYFLTENNG